MRWERRRRWRSVRPELVEEVEGEEREKETDDGLRVRVVAVVEVMVLSVVDGCGEAARFSSQSGCASVSDCLLLLLSSSILAMADDEDS